MSEQTFARGNVAYGGTGAATTGPVDPSGYVQRSMDSDQRSGLAAAALQRRLTGSTDLALAQSAAPATQPVGDSTITAVAHPSGTGQYYSSAAPEVASVLPPVSTGPVAAPIAKSAPMPGVNNPIAANYGNHPNPIPGHTLAQLPNDPKLAAMEDALYRQKLLFEGDQGNALQRRLAQLTDQEAQMNEAAPRNEAGIQANFGSRGLGFSSGYLNKLGDSKEALLRGLDTNHSNATAAQNAYQTALQRFLDNYVAKMGAIQGNQATWDNQALANSSVADVLKRK